MNPADLITPLLLVGTASYALFRGTDVFSALTDGAGEGMRTVARIFPALVALLTGASMLRASGALERLSAFLQPVLSVLGIPAPCVPLMLLRPISGSGALAFAAEIIAEYGADSLPGRTAAVMLGATETTFYVITVYFGAAGIKKARRAVAAALCADLAGFLSAALFSRLFWG